MRKITTINVRVQPSEDLIDFPVSDMFRDHYAAQGMTYPSGRYPRRQENRPPSSALRDANQALDASRQEANRWKTQVIDLQTRCARLEEELRKLHQPKPIHSDQCSSAYKGVSLDVCA